MPNNPTKFCHLGPIVGEHSFTCMKDIYCIYGVFSCYSPQRYRIYIPYIYMESRRVINNDIAAPNLGFSRPWQKNSLRQGRALGNVFASNEKYSVFGAILCLCFLEIFVDFPLGLDLYRTRLGCYA